MPKLSEKYVYSQLSNFTDNSEVDREDITDLLKILGINAERSSLIWFHFELFAGGRFNFCFDSLCILVELVILVRCISFGGNVEFAAWSNLRSSSREDDC